MVLSERKNHEPPITYMTNHSLACCFKDQKDLMHTKKRKNESFTEPAAKRNKLSNPTQSKTSTSTSSITNIESRAANVSPYTTKRGKKGIKVDGVPFSLKHQRKTDGIMVWKCCRCYCSLETTSSLEVVKRSEHKKASCIQASPLHATTTHAAPHADTTSKPHFVETTHKRTALGSQVIS